MPAGFPPGRSRLRTGSAWPIVQKCPVCGNLMPGVILVCGACWALVPRRDQIQFRRLYIRFRKHPKSYEPKGGADHSGT